MGQWVLESYEGDGGLPGVPGVCSGAGRRPLTLGRGPVAGLVVVVIPSVPIIIVF